MKNPYIVETSSIDVIEGGAGSKRKLLICRPFISANTVSIHDKIFNVHIHIHASTHAHVQTMRSTATVPSRICLHTNYICHSQQTVAHKTQKRNGDTHVQTAGLMVPCLGEREQ